MNETSYGTDELQRIIHSMPFVLVHSCLATELSNWALVFRDHFVDNSVGFVLAMERAGIAPEWIFTLDKGDRTRNRHRIARTFVERGYRCGVLDNGLLATLIPASDSLTAALLEIDRFVDDAHGAGKKVIVVDDGGLIMCGYGSQSSEHPVDAAIELTVSGLKRIASVDSVAIPIVDVARSRTKALLAYPEIADSCVRRLREVLPTKKLIGRPITVVGFGELGSRLAHSLRCLGARVTVVDTDVFQLVRAAEEGFNTHRDFEESISHFPPFLIASATGEQVLTEESLPLLPDEVFLAPFATRDFSILFNPSLHISLEEIENVGIRFRTTLGKAINLLGNGRSMNLFEADDIPNQGYDAYRAATLLVAKAICANTYPLGSGIHREFTDKIVTESGLLDAYYSRYLCSTAGQ